MAKNIEIKFDEKKLRRIEKMLRNFPRVMPRVMSRGVNRTAVTARAKIVKEIAAKINLKQKTIRSGIDIRRATYRRWVATIGISSSRQPLFGFGAKRTKKGISYMIDKSTGRKKLAHAFIATMPGDPPGAFQRIDKSRLPIKELRGVSLGHTFEDSATIAAQVTGDAFKNLEHNIDAQVALILGRAA